MPQTLILSLGKQAPHFELAYSVRPTRLASVWIGLVAECLKRGGPRDRCRFASFASDPAQELRDRIGAIEELLVELRQLHPEVDFGRVDFSDLQAEVNRLHVNFADRHLVRRDLLPGSVQLWSEFNSQLHMIESVLGSQGSVNKLGIRGANLTVTFNDSPVLPLEPADFEDAVLYRTFGTIYLEYSQVGRHFFELFNAGDTRVPKAHIQPFRRMSADMYAWFGHNQGHSYARELEREMEQWFAKEKEHPPLSELEYSWNPRDLGLGFIPVATLAQPLFSTREIVQLQKRIYEHPYVAGLRVE